MNRNCNRRNKTRQEVKRTRIFIQNKIRMYFSAVLMCVLLFNVIETAPQQKRYFKNKQQTVADTNIDTDIKRLSRSYLEFIKSYLSRRSSSGFKRSFDHVQVYEPESSAQGPCIYARNGRCLFVSIKKEITAADVRSFLNTMGKVTEKRQDGLWGKRNEKLSRKSPMLS